MNALLPLQSLDQWICVGSVDLCSVGVSTGLTAACGENAQPSLLVDLFINGLRLLCVFKRIMLPHGNCNSDLSFISFNMQL